MPTLTENSRDRASPPRRSKQIAEENLNRFDLLSWVLPKKTDDEKRIAYKNGRNVWMDNQAIILIGHHELSLHANVFDSRTIFKPKDCDHVKACNVPWGQRDPENQELRTDSPCFILEIFLLLLSNAAKQRWKIAQMDNATAFLLARGFDWDVFARPLSKEVDRSRLWRLTAASYGLADTGRINTWPSDLALTMKFRLNRSKYESLLY